jgi:hypothetical protein
VLSGRIDERAKGRLRLTLYHHTNLRMLPERCVTEHLARAKLAARVRVEHQVADGLAPRSRPDRDV